MEKVNGTERAERARNWTFILYPKECNGDYLKILENLCVPCCVSPLHTPENEKPHRHVLISGDKKTDQQILNEVCMSLGETVEIDGKPSIKGVTKPQRVVNLKSTVRYFLHLDNPKKQQFDEKVLTDFGGFDSSKYLVSKAEKDSEKYLSIKDVIKIIKEQKIGSLLDLLDYLGKADDNLFQICCDNAYLCTQLTNVYKMQKKIKTTGQVAEVALE